LDPLQLFHVLLVLRAPGSQQAVVTDLKTCWRLRPCFSTNLLSM